MRVSMARLASLPAVASSCSSHSQRAECCTVGGRCPWTTSALCFFAKVTFTSMPLRRALLDCYGQTANSPLQLHAAGMCLAVPTLQRVACPGNLQRMVETHAQADRGPVKGCVRSEGQGLRWSACVRVRASVCACLCLCGVDGGGEHALPPAGGGVALQQPCNESHNTATVKMPKSRLAVCV